MLEKVFQSRAGFSECLDPPCNASSTRRVSFNPVLGFLSVSTFEYETDDQSFWLFQSRAGFSECLDRSARAG